MSPTLQGSILLVDDEAAIVRALHRALRIPLGNGVKIVTCNSGSEALAELIAQRFDVIVSDLRMPNMGGMELLTGTADFTTAQEAVNQFGLYRYLTKPWETDELVRHITSAIAFSVEQRARQDHATQWVASQGQASPEELERRRLEAMEPGITEVEWDAEGCVIMR